MAPRQQSGPRDAVRALTYLLIIIALFVVTTWLHYFTPQVRLLRIPANIGLERHTIERFLLVLPVIVATHAFRWKGGLFALMLAVGIMLPRAIWITSAPADALTETAAAAATGGLAIWSIEAQARQKSLHQEAASRLRALSQVTAQITSELELDKILPQVLQIATALVGADGGGIALSDRDGRSIHYPYLDNLPWQLRDLAIPLGSGAAGEAMTTGHPVILENYQHYPGAIPAFARAGLTSVVSIPIVSRERSFGAITLASVHGTKRFSEADIDLLTSFGRQAGIAIENARLYDRMRFYARQIIQAQEEERERIARELHDETIQMLIVVSRRLELLANLPEPLPEAARQLLASVQELLRSTQKGVRRFAQGLRPPTLEHLGLVAATRGMVNDLIETDEITASFQVRGDARRLAPEEELTLFRIAQEALRNARQHAGASRIEVRLAFCPDRVRLTVNDNGRGFDVPRRTDDLVTLGKLGLIGMDERAQSLGGTLTLQSRPGEGTTILADIPVQPGHDQQSERTWNLSTDALEPPSRG
jgi:signal transduction histidine kinase